MTGQRSGAPEQLERLRAIYRDVLGDQAVAAGPATRHADLPGWSAAVHLQILAGVESEFGIKVTSREASLTGRPDSTLGLLLGMIAARTSPSSHALRDAVGSASSAVQRQRLLEAFVMEQVAEVLDLPVATIDRERTFADLGITSSSAVELASRLESGLGLSLTPALSYNYPTVAQLVPYLLRRLESRIG